MKGSKLQNEGQQVRGYGAVGTIDIHGTGNLTVGWLVIRQLAHMRQHSCCYCRAATGSVMPPTSMSTRFSNALTQPFVSGVSRQHNPESAAAARAGSATLDKAAAWSAAGKMLYSADRLLNAPPTDPAASGAMLIPPAGHLAAACPGPPPGPCQDPGPASSSSPPLPAGRHAHLLMLQFTLFCDCN